MQREIVDAGHRHLALGHHRPERRVGDEGDVLKVDLRRRAAARRLAGEFLHRGIEVAQKRLVTCQIEHQPDSLAADHGRPGRKGVGPVKIHLQHVSRQGRGIGARTFDFELFQSETAEIQAADFQRAFQALPGAPGPPHSLGDGLAGQQKAYNQKETNRRKGAPERPFAGLFAVGCKRFFSHRSYSMHSFLSKHSGQFLLPMKA